MRNGLTSNNLIFGHTWEEIQDMQQKKYKAPIVARREGKDFGADPLGNGKFKMVPSGDVVDLEERDRRLS